MKKVLFGLLTVALIAPSIALAGDPPTISEVWPLEAVVDTPIVLSVTASDPDGVESCNMKISSRDEGPMTYDSATNSWQFTWTFDDSRTASSVRGYCTDSLGDSVNGPSKVLEILLIERSLDIGDPEVTDTGESEVDATDFSEEMIVLESPVLIKSPCPGGETIHHPCRTVYFLDNQGTRHAFPNEGSYFTWYTDFSNIHVINTDVMSFLALGHNIRYHPGTKMVKYPSVNKVYTVSQYGVLRPIANEEAAVELYGLNWNQKIDDISEAFFGNYTYGAEVTGLADYSPTNQIWSVASINDNVDLIEVVPESMIIQ